MFQKLHKSLDGLKPIELVHPESLKGKKVIVRCDFNVPIKNGKILSTLRIEKTYRTINYLKNSGAKIILISHIGRDKEDSLKPVLSFLNKKYEVNFIEDLYTYACNNVLSSIKEGEIVLIENIRKWNGEKNKDPQFIKLLSSFADIYVNEAFPVSHRDHSSITGIPIYLPGHIGFQFKDEIENLSKVFEPEHPFLVMIGGAKFKTKIPLIETLIDKADNIFIGGALSNDIYRVKGYKVGKSTVSDSNLETIKKIASSNKIFTPIDIKTVNKFGFTSNKSPQKIKENDKVVDGGPKTFKFLKQKIKESKFIIWNGPFGLYEEGFNYLSKKIEKEIAKSEAFTIVGGGDTLIEIEKSGNEKDFSFVSMGGGAMLDFISDGTLVGIEVLKKD